jgi:DNA-binding FadR family transcriptional regulator
MPRKVRQALSSLKAKGFIEDREGHHIFLIYETRDGFRTEIRTRVSHQSGGGDISDSLLAAMARQVRLSRRDLEQLIDCPLSREQYETKLDLEV